MKATVCGTFSTIALLCVCLTNMARSNDGSESDPTPFPQPASIKGLQVQMVDDAIALGIHHAGINFAINGLYAKPDTTNGIEWTSEGKRTSLIVRM